MVKRIVCALALIMFIASCEKSYDFYIHFENASDKEIKVYHDFEYPKDSTGILRFIDANGDQFLPGTSEKLTIVTCGKIQSWYWMFDYAEQDFYGYISLYVFEYDSSEGKYHIIARYDLRREDIDRMNFKLTYPPTPEMAGIHMWYP